MYNRITVNDESKSDVFCSKILSQNLPGGTEENHKSFSQVSGRVFTVTNVTRALFKNCSWKFTRCRLVL
jgi:hypothetical protein